MREKINKTLDDTIVSNDGWAVQMARENDMTPEDIKEISDQWANVVKDICLAGILGFLLLLLMILWFRYLTRRRKYDVMEKAIMNNYPLNELSLNDNKHSAIYVQQPVVTAAPQATATPAGQVPMGTPLEGMTPQNPIVMTDMINWRAMMPAVRVLGWGVFLALFGYFVAGGSDPFTYVGLALMFVGLCKGFILYKEQKALQEAWRHSREQMPQREPMRQGIPVPPPMDGYNSDVSAND